MALVCSKCAAHDYFGHVLVLHCLNTVPPVVDDEHSSSTTGAPDLFWVEGSLCNRWVHVTGCHIQRACQPLFLSVQHKSHIIADKWHCNVISGHSTVCC